MKKIKTILMYFILINLELNAQTKTIAYKSHSGNNCFNKCENLDNYGVIENHFEPQMKIDLKIDSIKKVSDTSYQEFSNNGVQTIFTSKVNLKKKNLPLLNEKYQDDVKKIGFQKKNGIKIKKKKVSKQNNIDWLFGFIILFGITISTIQLRKRKRNFDL